jgi:Cu/Ag efflux protein CusF
MNFIKTSHLHTLALVAALGLATASTWAQTPGAAQPSAAAAPQTSAADDMTDGVVRKVDMAQHKVTIKHGAIKNLDMPGMTMVFAVADPAMLNGLNKGDTVRFKADNIAGKLTVTEIAPQR